ncbi:MAG: amidohydrolase family protein [Thermomicrobiales bacterium]|nr:amidohydrolase family protein [Thermomicrobiales bacterium]
MFDTVITGGTIIDGTGRRPAFRADLAVTEGKISAIGAFESDAARETIDATGLTIAPGLIDVHIHSEIALLLAGNPVGRYGALRQGVTTQLLAPDGFGWAHLDDQQRSEMWQYTEFSTGKADLGPPWPGAADYLSLFPGNTPANVVPQVPHLPIRQAVMGWESREATDREVARMGELVAEWLDAGAVAFNTGLDYQPVAYASTEELIALSRVATEAGAIYAAHIRYGILGREEAWRETFRISQEAGIPIHFSHENVDGITGPLLDEAAGRIDVTFESYNYAAGCTHLAQMMPTWAQAGGPDAVIERLQDTAIRAELTAYLEDRLTVSDQRPAKLVIAANQSGRDIGRSLADVASERSQPIGEAAIEMMIEEHPYALMVFHRRMSDEENRERVRATISHPAMMVASDGIYHGTFSHPRSYGCFAQAIRLGVRELGAVSLEEAVHKMTGKPATRFKVANRGFCKEGYAADLVIFDAATIADGSTWEAPLAPPTGIARVMVNGEWVVVDNEPTGRLPGQVLRRQDWTPPA